MKKEDEKIIDRQVEIIKEQIRQKDGLRGDAKIDPQKIKAEILGADSVEQVLEIEAALARLENDTVAGKAAKSEKWKSWGVYAHAASAVAVALIIIFSVIFWPRDKGEGFYNIDDLDRTQISAGLNILLPDDFIEYSSDLFVDKN